MRGAGCRGAEIGEHHGRSGPGSHESTAADRPDPCRHLKPKARPLLVGDWASGGHISSAPPSSETPFVLQEHDALLVDWRVDTRPFKCRTRLPGRVDVTVQLITEGFDNATALTTSF